MLRPLETDKSRWSWRLKDEAAGNTNGRSFSDCDDTCPIGYSVAQALGTRG